MTSVSFSNGYALLIGIGADLPITVKDATALYNVLTHSSCAAYPLEQVELLTEVKANKQNILIAFDQLIKQVNHNSDATVIIYFSGHGGRVNQPGKPAEYFLVPHGYDLDHLADTTISSLEFTEKIEAINARKLVVLLDCCHAGGIPALKIPRDVSIKSSPLLPDLLRVLETGNGRVIVASSLESEYSYTGTPYSIFTTCLLEALEGKASVKKDGFARILDILIYLLDQVPVRAHGSQHPFVNKVLNLGDNFPLCYYAGGDKHVSCESSSSESSFVSISMTPERLDRLRERHHLLQGERATWVEKVTRIRRALIIETSVVVRFQLEQQLQENEAFLARLDSELDELEQVLTHSESDQKPLTTYEHSSMEVQSKALLPKTTSPQQFDVFLSHSHVDAEWVEKLAIRLEDEEALRVWLDKWYLIPGQSWQQELALSIDQARSCAVCISESTPTGWFREEIERALNRQTFDASFRVIPVLLPNAKTVTVNNFLELRTWVDFRSSELAYAFHTLVCGIKGISPGRWPSRGDTNRGM